MFKMNNMPEQFIFTLKNEIKQSETITASSEALPNGLNTSRSNFIRIEVSSC